MKENPKQPATGYGGSNPPAKSWTLCGEKIDGGLPPKGLMGLPMPTIEAGGD